MKYTPGRWTIEGPLVVTNGGAKIIANLFRLTNNKANARLICAAPVMVELLKKISNKSLRDMMTDADWDMVREVVAKATGGNE